MLPLHAAAFVHAAVALLLPSARPESHAARQPQALPTVYVAPFTSADTSARGRDLQDLVPRLISLSLAQETRLTASRMTTAPRCTSGAPAEPPDGAAGARLAPGDYSVSGTITGDSAEFTISYAIAKCDSVGQHTLVDSEPERIPWVQASVRVSALAEAITAAITRDLPAVTVSLGSFEARGPGLDSLAAAARESVRGSVLRAAALRLVPAGGEYVVWGWTDHLGGDRVRVATAVRNSAGDQWQTFMAEGRRDTVYALFRSTANRATTYIRARQLAPPAAVGAGVQGDSAAKLASARLSCWRPAAPACGGDSTAVAAAYYLVATQAAPPWKAQALYGRTELASGRESNAVRGLEQALESWSRASGRDNGDGAAIARDLARAYRQLRNNVDAARLYTRSLELDSRQTAVYVERAQSMRAAGEYGPALAGLAEAPGRGASRDTIAAEIETTLREIPAGRLDEAESALNRACAAPAMNRRCSGVLLARAHVMVAERRPDSDVRAVAHALLELSGDDLGNRANAYAVLLAIALGPQVNVPVRGGDTDPTFPRVLGDSVERYVNLLRRLPAEGVPRPVREWVLRMEALYLLSRGELPTALARAQDAASALPNRNAAYVRGVITYMLGRRFGEAAGRGPANPDSARYWYEVSAATLLPLVDSGVPRSYRFYRAANHHLGRDQESARVLDRLAAGDSGGSEVREALMFVTLEYLHDFAGSYRLVRGWDQRGLLTSAKDTLMAAEAAILAGERQAARTWLDPDVTRTLSPCPKAVAEIYRLWTYSSSDNESGVRQSFARWAELVAQHRRNGTPSCWEFGGARYVLDSPAAPPRADVLRSMMDSLEDPRLPIPRL